jgi:hypothetical protein
VPASANVALIPNTYFRDEIGERWIDGEGDRLRAWGVPRAVICSGPVSRGFLRGDTVPLTRMTGTERPEAGP